MQTYSFTDTGVPWTARLVREGDAYGNRFVLTHDKPDPLIEFYDARFKHCEFGQFVSRYYASTLKDHIENARGGLVLVMSVPEWRLSSGALSAAYRALI